VLVNFTPVFTPFTCRLPLANAKRDFNTDRRSSAAATSTTLRDPSRGRGVNGFPFHADLCVPPLSCCYFRYDKVFEKPAAPPRPARAATGARMEESPMGSDEGESPLSGAVRPTEKTNPMDAGA
jgi:hypothetical protein